MRDRKPDLWIAAALFVGNLLILGPWTFAEFSDQPWNNGYIYIAIARLFRDLKWTWNPLHYGGAPFHYLYPPLFHALVTAIPFVSLARAFHIATAIGYALAPVCLYVLARVLLRSRPLAFFAGVAYSIFPSPIYAFLTPWRNIALPYAHGPWAFVDLVAFEEAGHAFALPIMFLTVAAAWRGHWRLASLLAAAVFLTNWPGLIGLGFALAGILVARKTPARAAGLVIVRKRPVVFREGDPALVGLFGLMRADDLPEGFRGQTWTEPDLIIRKRDGKIHPEYSAVKLAIGFPP